MYLSADDNADGTGILHFQTQGSSADSMTIKTGLVGIGTTSPAAQLQVLDNISGGMSITTLGYLNSTSNAYTTGKLLNVDLTQAAATGTSVSGNISSISFNPTYSTAITTPAITGNVLNVARNVITNADFASTLTLSGALASFSDSATQTQGTLTSTADVVQISQNYSGNTGAALNITSTGSFALRVNDNGTFTDSTPFVIDGSGFVGIGTTGPAQALEVNGKVQIDDLTAAGGGAAVLSSSGVLTTVSSSERYKENIVDYGGNVLEKITALRPVRFNWKENTLTPGMADFGLIAEEVAPLFPDLITFEADNQTIRGVKYEKLPVLLVKAFQEQQAELDGLGNLVSSLPTSQQVDDQTSLETQMAEFETRLAALESQVNAADTAIASISAQLLQQISDASLTPDDTKLSSEEIPLLNAQTATVSGTLMVLGKTTMADLGLTGNLSVGLLSIDGLEGSINSLGNPLKLQSLAGAGNLDIFNGQVIIEEKGNIKTLGEITAKKYNVDLDESPTASLSGVLSASAGKAVILAGKTKLTIQTTALTSKSLIFVTPEMPVAVGTKKTDATHFEITLKQPETSDLKVSWWVVN
jgi:uncharacterized coiled-coil protein SlyX